MANKRLKAKSDHVREALQAALAGGAMPIRDACKAIRILKALSQQDFADSVGVALNVVKELESGRSDPRLSSLEKLAAAAGLKVVFAAPKYSVRLEDFHQRAEEKQQARERDFEQVAAGIDPRKISADNTINMPDFSYELPKF